MTRTSLILLLLSFSMALIFALEYHQQQLQYARGIINSTSTICINGKCTTTMCIDNEPCRTLTSNSTTSTTAIPDNSTKNKDNATLSPAPLRTV
jgi:hypothetical protein